MTEKNLNIYTTLEELICTNIYLSCSKFSKKKICYYHYPALSVKLMFGCFDKEVRTT